MNDSPYGLTASIWTNAAANPESEEVFLRIANELETGTVFLNRYEMRPLQRLLTDLIHSDNLFLGAIASIRHWPGRA